MNETNTISSLLQISLQKSICASIGATATSLLVTPLDVAKTRLQEQQKDYFLNMNKISNLKLNPILNKRNQHTYKRKNISSSIIYNKLCNVKGCLGNYHNKLKIFQNTNYLTTSGACTRFLTCYSIHHKEYNSSLLNNNSNKIKLKGTFETLNYIYKKEGFFKLFSGLKHTLYGSIPNTIFYFTSYDILLTNLNNKNNNNNNKIMIFHPLIAGIGARMIAATFVSPIELLRTQMQSSHGNLHNNNIIKSLQFMIEKEGFYSLYKGLSATLLRDVPFSAIYWSCFENIKKNLLSYSNNNKYNIPYYNKNNELIITFVSGCISGGIAATMTTPFDLVKTLQQIHYNEQNKKLKTFQLLFNIYKQNGINGIMTGLHARFIRIVPACGIMITTYEFGKKYINHLNE